MREVASLLSCGSVVEEVSVLQSFRDIEFSKELLVYCFRRRFSWGDDGTTDTSRIDPSIRRALNEQIDNVVLGPFLSQEFNSQAAEALKCTINELHNIPAAREQGFRYFFEWLRRQLPSTDDNFLVCVRDVFISGLSDVWSAIRKLAAGKLCAILEALNVSSLRDLFVSLLELCRDDRWQAVEGALLGINAILRRFSWERSELIGNLRLLFGSGISFHAFPDFITNNIKNTLYDVLAHEQKSIREIARRAFWGYLSRSGFEETLESFSEIVIKLDAVSCKHGADWPLEAYEAEGLLGVFAILIKNIPSTYLFTVWSFYHRSLDLYLGHPASTVRQMASTIYHQLVSRDVDPDLRLTRVVLQALVHKLPHVDIHRLNHDVLGMEHLSLSSRGNDDFDKSEENLQASLGRGRWEWKEGRMLAFELILQFFVVQHSQKVIPYVFSVSPHKRMSPFSKVLGTTSHAGTTTFLSGSSPPSSTNEPVVSTPPHSRSLTGESTVIQGDHTPSPLHPHTRLRLSVFRKLALDSKTESIPRLEKLEKMHLDIDVSGVILDSGVNLSSPNAQDIDSSSLHSTMSFRDALHRILRCTLDSFSSRQWELSRMANQVLPYVVQCLYWTDLDGLEKSFRQFFQAKDSLPAWFACSAFEYAVLECGRIENSVACSPNVDSAASLKCSDVNRRFLRFIPDAVSLLSDLCHASKSERVTIAAVQALVLLTSHVVLVEAGVDSGDVCNVFRNVIRRLGIIHKQCRGLIPLEQFKASSPRLGLSPAPRRSIPMDPVSLKLQKSIIDAEYALINRIAPLLPDFVLSGNLTLLLEFLPLLLNYVCRRDDIVTRVPLLEAVGSIFCLPFGAIMSVVNEDLKIDPSVFWHIPESPFLRPEDVYPKRTDSKSPQSRTGDLRQRRIPFPLTKRSYSDSCVKRPMYIVHDEKKLNHSVRVRYGERKYLFPLNARDSVNFPPHGALEESCNIAVSRLLFALNSRLPESIVIRCIMSTLRLICWIVGDLRFIVQILQQMVRVLEGENEDIVDIATETRTKRGDSNVSDMVMLGDDSGVLEEDTEEGEEDRDSDEEEDVENEEDDEDWDDWDSDIEELDKIVLEFGYFLKCIETDFREVVPPFLRTSVESLQARKMFGIETREISLESCMSEISSSDAKVVQWIRNRYEELKIKDLSEK